MLSPLLESPVCRAQGVIVSYYVPPKVDLKDINGATTMIYNATSEDVNLIWNFTFDEKSEDETCVTIITTDIGKKERNDLPPPPFLWQMRSAGRIHFCNRTFCQFQCAAVA